MKVESGLDMHSFAFNSPLNCVATIGSFDGVHRGHQCLLGQVRKIADERMLKAMAITFATSPKKVLGAPGIPQLTSIEERVALLRQAGMDEVSVLDFTPQMANLTARDFMQQILKEQLHVETLVIGYDHRFGRGRNEGFEDYVRYGRELGIDVVRSEAYMDEGKPISSSRIRDLLSKGKITEANHLLGYQYALHGEVVDGYKEGRKMGFPTANIRPLSADKQIPADGVYAVWVNVDADAKGASITTTEALASQRSETLSSLNENEPSGWKSSASLSASFLGMLNIGYRPTLNNGKERSIEVHILDFEGDLYGKTITLKFVHRLRDERTFTNLDELTAQLNKDKMRAREILAINNNGVKI